MSDAASFPRLLSLARPETRTLALGIIALVGSSGLALAYPMVVQSLIDGIDSGVKSGDSGASSLVDRSVALLIGLFVVGAALGAARAWLFTVAGERIVARLRRDLFSALLRQETAFFDERRTGELTSRLAADTTVLQNAVTVNISMLLRFGVMGVGAVVLLFVTSWRLSLVTLVMVPVAAGLSRVAGKRMKEVARSAQDALAGSATVAEEVISGIRTVRSFAQEEREVGRYGSAVDESFAVGRQRAGLSALFQGLGGFAGYAVVGLVLWYGGHLLVAKQLTIGTLTSYLLYTLTAAFSIGALSSLYEDFMKAIGASSRVFELLDRTPMMTSGSRSPWESPELASGAPRAGHLALRDVVFAYPARKSEPVLKKVSLTLAPGEVVALVGPSGSGKSTLSALISRLYDPDEGQLCLNGIDYRELDVVALRRAIGVVSQEPILFATSIADNIRYGKADATDAEVEAAARAANAHDFVSRFPAGYQTRVGERGTQLSGGQKQRVAIARAILASPAVLVLDEATSALDAESEHLVQEALDRLMESRTTLVIAHRLSTIRRATRVVVVAGGTFVEEGSHDELMARGGLYHSLVERQLLGTGDTAKSPA